MSQRSRIFDSGTYSNFLDERPMVVETSSHVIISVQRYGLEMVLWAVDKSDIDAGTASVAKALQIGSTSDAFYKSVECFCY